MTNGTVYHYVVSAFGAGVGGADSDEVSAVPSVAIAPEEFYFADYAVEGSTNLSQSLSNIVLDHLYGILAADTLTLSIWSNIVIEAGTCAYLQFDIPIGGLQSNRHFKLGVHRQ